MENILKVFFVTLYNYHNLLLNSEKMFTMELFIVFITKVYIVKGLL